MANLSGETDGAAVSRPTAVGDPPSMDRAVSPISGASPIRKRFLLPTTGPISSDINDVERGRNLFENSDRSRKRNRAAALASKDALVQRSGPVSPGLLPRGVSPRAALAPAQGMRPFGKALKLAFSPYTHCRVKFANERPKLTKRLR